VTGTTLDAAREQFSKPTRQYRSGCTLFPTETPPSWVDLGPPILLNVSDHRVNIVNINALTPSKGHRISGYARGDGVNAPTIRDANGTLLWAGLKDECLQHFDLPIEGECWLTDYTRAEVKL
jgi:hypothetical protein